MAFSSWRGLIGMINPTMRPGMTEEVIRLLPEGIGIIPLFLNITEGTRAEFKTMTAAYETEIERLVPQEPDLIHPNGAPPFMVHGFEGEAKIVRRWRRKYGIPIFTAGQNHVAAMKALKIKNFVGATYFSGTINQTFSNYFKEAGFKVKAMAGIDVPFNKVQQLSGEQIYEHIKANFLKQKGADAIYMLGSGWRSLNIIHLLEQDLSVPVIHPVTARVWEFQKRLRVNEPREGYGVLLSELP
jgi:maleate isomerase